MADKPKQSPKPETLHEQRVRAARQAMLEQMKRDALDG